MQNLGSRHHYTKDELLELKNNMSKTSGEFIDIRAPKELKKKQQVIFYDYAYKLISYGMNELDENCPADYIIARELFLHYRRQQIDIMKAKPFSKWHCYQDVEDAELKELLEFLVKNQRAADAKYYQQLADKEFNRCMACANAMGLTISSRAKLVIREADSEDVEL